LRVLRVPSWFILLPQRNTTAFTKEHKGFNDFFNINKSNTRITVSEISTFESRSGRVKCSAEELFNFVTDIRNFERIIPRGSTGDIKIDKDSCSIRVNMLGTVSVRISETAKFNKVVYSGNAMHINDFTLVLNILGKSDKEAEVKVILSAEMNPFLKMMAVEPVRQFLETLIREMENFRGWKETI